VTYEFTTKEDVYIEEADFETELFRLFINKDGTLGIFVANDEDYDIQEDVTIHFDVEAIKTICINSNAENVTDKYDAHYIERRENGEYYL
jgi:hypothetical protein